MRGELEHVRAGTTPDRGLFELTTGTAPEAVAVDITYERLAATPDLVEAFGVPDGTELLRRVYTFVVDGKPHQISSSSSYLLYAMVEETALADPANERPGRGTMAQLKELGVTVEHTKIDIRARMPSPGEVTLFGMSEGTPIMVDRCYLYAADLGCVAVSDTVSPADRIMYGIDLGLDQL